MGASFGRSPLATTVGLGAALALATSSEVSASRACNSRLRLSSRATCLIRVSLTDLIDLRSCRTRSRSASTALTATRRPVSTSWATSVLTVLRSSWTETTCVLSFCCAWATVSRRAFSWAIRSCSDRDTATADACASTSCASCWCTRSICSCVDCLAASSSSS